LTSSRNPVGCGASRRIDAALEWVSVSCGATPHFERNGPPALAGHPCDEEIEVLAERERAKEDRIMTTPIATGSVHHLRLTVRDVARSRSFYTEVLGFQHVMDLPSGVFLSNGAVGLGIGPSPDPSRAPGDDRFDEARVGLDHLSFGVASRDELERARRLLDERGVPHGEITDLGDAFGMYILAFRDPDNIQLELTALYG
jgi:glyoxylase I family protein